MAPLRASLLAGGDRAIRWQATVSAGLLTASIAGLGGLNPIVNPWLERAPDVVEDNGEVWLMDADGGRQTRLLEAVDGVDLALPVWSPDGSQIAYSRFEGRGDDPATGNQDIWVANADGTGARPFATGLTWQWFPRWSPDGAWIGYTEEARRRPMAVERPGRAGPGPGAPGACVSRVPMRSAVPRQTCGARRSRATARRVRSPMSRATTALDRGRPTAPASPSTAPAMATPRSTSSASTAPTRRVSRRPLGRTGQPRGRPTALASRSRPTDPGRPRSGRWPQTARACPRSRTTGSAASGRPGPRTGSGSPTPRGRPARSRSGRSGPTGPIP